MVDTVKLNYRTIKDLELVAFYELPENRRNTEIVVGYEKEFFYDSVDKLELALMNPRRMPELERLDAGEVMELYVSWVIVSKIQHDTKWNQQRKKERSMASILAKFTNWLGVTKPKPVKQERDSTGRFIDPKEEPAQSKKTLKKVAPARATATAKKSVTKKKGTK
jgi:hypothetical protein